MPDRQLPAGPRPRGPAAPPPRCFSVVQCKGLTIINAAQLRALRAVEGHTGGKDKETSVCDPSYSISLPGSRYHSHLQNSPARSVQNVKLFKVIEIGKNYFATQPPFAVCRMSGITGMAAGEC